MKITKHWIVLILCCMLVSASLGIMANAAGVFYTPIATDLNLSTGAVALSQTIFLIVVSLGAYFVPVMVTRFPYRLILAVSVAINAIATIFMGFVSVLPAFYILGAIRGLSASFFFMVPISMIINNWFEKSRGLAMSIAMCFNGVFGAIASPALTAVIGAVGWRMAYAVMAIAIVVLCLPAILYPWSFNPRACGLKPYGYQDDIELSASNVTHKKEPLSITVFACFILFALFTFGATATAQHFPGYATTLHLTIGATMLSMTMIGNIIATVACGPIADKIGPVKATLIFLVIGTIGMAMLLIGNPVTLMIGAFLFGMEFCMGSVCLPLLTELFFGVVNYNTVYPTLALAGNIGSAAYLTIIGFIYDGFKSYMPAVLFALFMLIISLVIIIGNAMAKAKEHPQITES